MNKNPLVETKRFWHPGTGIVHSDPDCTSARRTKWDLIELEPGNLPEMIVTCKRCLKNPNAADDKGEQCVYCGKDSWTCEHFEPPILDGSESEGE